MVQHFPMCSAANYVLLHGAAFVRVSVISTDHSQICVKINFAGLDVFIIRHSAPAATPTRAIQF